MKKFIPVVLLVMAFMSASSQTNKNDWMVGGNFRLNTSSGNTQIAFSPNASVFITDNFAVGGGIGIDYTKTGATKNTSFGIGPMVRYYFTTVDQAVRPIVQGNLNFISQRQKVISSNISSSITGLNYFIGGGAAMFISKNVSIDALAGYDHTKFKNFSGSGGFALTIGFQVYLLKDQVDKVIRKKK
jgi:hypothetical protein